MMMQDHTKAQASLDSIAIKFGIPVPAAPDSAHLVMAAQLQNLSGYEFDTTYIGAQLRDHQATVAIFEFELSNGNNQEIKNFANTNLPIIQMHLQEAQTIQQEIH